MIYLIYLLLFISLTLLFFSIYRLAFRRRLKIRSRLKQFESKSSSKEDNYLDERMALPFHKRVFGPAISKITIKFERLLPLDMYKKMETKLVMAGKLKNYSVTEWFFIFAVIILSFALIGIGLFVMGVGETPWIFPPIGLFAGIVLIRFYVQKEISKRKEAIKKELPELLDLMSVSVEAGLGFDAALSKVAEESTGPMSEEFRKVITEISMGKTRREALKDLKDRIGILDLDSFINSVIQAEQLGSSITNVLKIESGELRRKRKQRAEEQAMKAPVKLLLPLVLFIFPTIFIVLLGPAMIQIIDTLTTM